MMRFTIWETLFVLSILGNTVVASGVTGAESRRELSPREIYEQTAPAVVMVMGHSDGGRSGSGGTGSIIQADGTILTNAHVVIEERTGKPYPRLSVFLKPARVTGDSKVDLARMFRARIAAFSQPLDLALLKLEGVTEPLPVVSVSDSDRSRIGDHVVAIGHPEQGGLWTLTTGVISAEVDNFNGVKGKNVFQTETGLNRGNSGGPLLDGEGHMIGINTAIARVAPDGLPITSISFSLKSSVATQWLRDQHVAAREALARSDSPRQDKSADRSLLLPQGQTTQPGNFLAAPRITSPSLPPEFTAQTVPSPRPYNLDRLISERNRAEADLEDMIKEMRGKLRGR